MTINPVQAQAQMNAQVVYDSPVLRPASPASSVGTAYAADATSPEDAELTDAQFEQHVLASLRLDNQQRPEELNADQDPLLTLTHVARQRPVEEFERKRTLDHLGLIHRLIIPPASSARSHSPEPTHARPRA